MSTLAVQLVVIAKEPRPGFVKTRLCPPCTEAEAAEIAEAALAQTLDVVRSVPAARHVLALDGAAGDWLPPGFDVIEQRQGGLGNRLQGVFDDCFAARDDPVIIVGMDTPQIRDDDLVRAADLLHNGSSAVLGPATDGGYWLVGLHHPSARLFEDVPMSAPHTFEQQGIALSSRGYVVASINELRDIDHVDDAVRVAATLTGTRFATTVHRVMTKMAR